MSTPSEPSEPDQRTGGWKTTAVTCALILLAGAGLLLLIFNTEPSAQRAEGTRTTAMIVDVTTADSGTFRPRIDVMGTVLPAEEIVLRPRVGGEVIELSREFTPGGFVEQGELLLRLDPSDYQNELQQRRSELRQARSELKLELGRREVAKEEYELLNETLKNENKSLVLREPQLKAARARVESARAALEQARLNLNRTRIRAPFNAHVLDRNVNRGSQVAAGDNLARLVGMDTYWVETTLPLSKLRWLSIPDTPGAPGSLVRIRNRSAWPEGEYRWGRVYKLVGELEEQARMVRLLISVEDPLARQTSSDSPPLILGSFVQTLIQGRPIPRVMRLARDHVRENGTVWLMRDGKLDIRDVQVVFRDEDYAYIRDGLEPDERVVTSDIATVVEGAPLRVKESPSMASKQGTQPRSPDTAPRSDDPDGGPP